MGRKPKDPAERRKPVKVRLIKREHTGKVTEPYRILEDLISKHHDELEPAKICMAWRSGWKADVDGVLTLARMRKATETDKYIFEADYDFVVEVNEEAWPALADQRKRMVLDHELYHGAPDLDRDGNQKLDARERLCWRCRKHPIQEFPEIIKRYGIEEVLGINAEARAAVEDATLPLFAGQQEGDGEASGDNGQPDQPDGWEAKPLAELGLRASDLSKFVNEGITTIGALSKLTEEHGEWWHREVPGIGEKAKERVSDLFEAFWRAHPEYCEQGSEA